MKKVDLMECRDRLDKIDSEIVRLFEERMSICGDVAESKIESGKAVYDAERERQKIDAVQKLTHNEFNRRSVREIFLQLMTVSRRLQYGLLTKSGITEPLGFDEVDELPVKNARIVFQGVEGAYGHEAALRFFGRDADISHVAEFEDTMKELESGNAGFAVLPLENSTAGFVISNYDLLAKYGNYIVGEVYVPVEHMLLGLPGMELSDIRTVYSHPQGLMQCSNFLNAHREWQQVSLLNTAVAAKKVLDDGDKTQAAVASHTAGEIYGLTELAQGISNAKGNTTRFAVLTKRPLYTKNARRISLIFEVPHVSGSLYNVLGNFIFNGINLTMIESRPIPERPFQYRFFADFEGNLSDDSVKNALTGLRAEASYMRILGNY